MKGLGALKLWPVFPPQDNASKLLLALMESRHDSENAERILISLRPQELVRLGWRSGGAVAQVGAGLAVRAQPSLRPKKRALSRLCPARWTSSRRPTCRKRSVRTQT